MTRTRPIFWDWHGTDYGDNWPRLGVREGKWKLLMTLDRSRMELYDIVDDRSQSNNLATANPQVVDRLAAEALAWRKTLPTQPPSSAFSKLRQNVKVQP